MKATSLTDASQSDSKLIRQPFIRLNTGKPTVLFDGFAKGTNRSYKSWLDRFSRAGQTAREFLTGLSQSSFRQARAALVAGGIPLGDLSKIPKAVGHKRIVDVPDDDAAKRLVESVPGQSGEVLRKMYLQCRTLPSVLKDDEFKGLWDVTVQRNLQATLKRLGFKRRFTCASIRHASARKIARENGFLAAHRALGVKTIKSTEWILGKKLLDDIARIRSTTRHEKTKLETSRTHPANP